MCGCGAARMDSNMCVYSGSWTTSTRWWWGPDKRQDSLDLQEPATSNQVQVPRAHLYEHGSKNKRASSDSRVDRERDFRSRRMQGVLWLRVISPSNAVQQTSHFGLSCRVLQSQSFRVREVESSRVLGSRVLES